MEFYVRSDLACEYFGEERQGTEGASWRVDRTDGFAVGRLSVTDETAAKRLGRPRGEYITVECGRLAYLGEGQREALTSLLATELRSMAERLTGKTVDADFSIFVAGLGNANLTADAVGPRTVGRLTATRHLREHEAGLYRALGCASLSALAPGVLGQTGIEVQELLRSAVASVRPDAVLAIDALAARSCDRLATTVQLCDTGICPGSGVGNHRAAISEETVGAPVIALGIPTVVSSATLVWDALSEAGIKEPNGALRQVLENGRSFFVSLKESDVVTDEMSELLADVIGRTFTGGV